MRLVDFGCLGVVHSTDVQLGGVPQLTQKMGWVLLLRAAERLVHRVEVAEMPGDLSCTPMNSTCQCSAVSVWLDPSCRLTCPFSLNRRSYPLEDLCEFGRRSHGREIRVQLEQPWAAESSIDGLAEQC